QPEDVLEHRTLFGREAGLAGGARLEHDLEVGAYRSGLPAEQGAQHAQKPTHTLPRRVLDAGYRNGELVSLAAGAGRLRTTGRVGLGHGSQNGLHSVRIGYAEPREDLALEILHGVSRRIRLVIVAQEVQEAMHRKMGKMVDERSAFGFRLPHGGLV